MLRSFSYLDTGLVDDFLAQVEGGLYEEESEKEQRSGSRGGGLQAGAGPVSAKYDKGSSSSGEVARVVRQTGPSRFDRLYEVLSAKEELVFLDAIDEAIWNQLSRGEVVEIEGIVRSAGVEKATDLFQKFSTLAPALRDAGAEVEIDQQAAAMFQALSAMTDMNESRDVTWVTIELASSPGFTFGAELRRSRLIRGLGEVEGEATVVGKVRRLLREGESMLLPSLFSGLEAVLPEDERSTLASMFDDPRVAVLGLGNPRLVYPAAILTPIAIFQ